MSTKIIVNKFGGGILTKNLIPLMVERLREQIKNGCRRCGGIEAFRADIRDAIPVGVGVAGLGGVHEVGAQAVGRDQAGPLTNQHQGDLRADCGTDLVLHRHPGLRHDHERCQIPVRQARQ